MFHNTGHYQCFITLVTISATLAQIELLSITDCSIQPVSSCSALSTLALCSVPYTQHIHRPSLVFIRLQLLAAPAVLHQSSALLISALLTPCPLHDTFHRPLHCPRSASATRHPSHLQDVGGWVPLRRVTELTANNEQGIPLRRVTELRVAVASTLNNSLTSPYPSSFD